MVICKMYHLFVDKNIQQFLLLSVFNLKNKDKFYVKYSQNNYSMYNLSSSTLAVFLQQVQFNNMLHLQKFFMFILQSRLYYMCIT